MILLGKELMEKKLVSRELRQFFGIGRTVGPAVLARLSIPRLSKVEELSEAQVASLTAFLSSTTISELPARTPVVDPAGERELLAGEDAREPTDKQRAGRDWGRKTLIESELRGKINADIRTLIDIGTYRGRRHRQSKPMKARSKHNAQTALRLNKPRRHFSTTAGAPSSSSSPSPFAPFRSLFSSRFHSM